MSLDGSVLLILLLAISCGVLGLVLWLRGRVHRTAQRVAQHAQETGVVRSAPANCLGILSKGKLQNRGNGTLLLTTSRLVFEPFIGSNRVDQARDSIVLVGTARSFLGKSLFRPLLLVEWRTPDDGTDSAAWAVGDLSGWLRDLHETAPR